MYKSMGIDKGHMLASFDTGAVGIGDEGKLTRAVGDKLIEKLRACGIKITDCTPDAVTSLGNSLYLRCAIANRDNVEFFVSIHFNSGGGQGTEVWAISAKDVAKRVCDSICELGFVNRGVKDGNHLYVLKNTNCPSILVECCFVDSQTDMDLYNKVGAEAIANKIVKGLIGVENVPSKYYVVTNYLPQTANGVELNALWYKYFTGVGIDRWYVKSNAKGLWIETQYMTQQNAQILAERLKENGLLYQLVVE